MSDLNNSIETTKNKDLATLEIDSPKPPKMTLLNLKRKNQKLKEMFGEKGKVCI